MFSEQRSWVSRYAKIIERDDAAASISNPKIPIDYDELRTVLGLDDAVLNSHLELVTTGAIAYLEQQLDLRITRGGFRCLFDARKLEPNDSFIIPGLAANLVSAAKVDGTSLSTNDLITRRSERNGQLRLYAGQDGWPDEWTEVDDDIELITTRGATATTFRSDYGSLHAAVMLQAGDLFDRLQTNAEAIERLSSPYRSVVVK